VRDVHPGISAASSRPVISRPVIAEAG
jgi:hypothetical protein